MRSLMASYLEATSMGEGLALELRLEGLGNLRFRAQVWSIGFRGGTYWCVRLGYLVGSCDGNIGFRSTPWLRRKRGRRHESSTGDISIKSPKP